MKNTLLSLLMAFAIFSSAQAQCDAPTNLQTSYSNNVTTFSWNPVAGAVSYTFELKQAWDNWAYPEWIDAASTNSYQLTGIMHSISIDWRVKTVCANGESVYQYSSVFTLPCPEPSNASVTGLSMTGATINWSAPAGYNTFVSDFGMAYRKVGTTAWTSLGRTFATSKAITNLLANTTYEWRVSMGCPYFSSSILTSTFTTLACNSAGTNSAEWISTFKLGSINRLSGAEAGGYVNANTTTNLVRGSNNSARIRVGQNGAFTNKQYKIYIDYNNNNIYEETEVVYGPASITNTGNINFNLTIPSNAIAGLHGMRVIMARTGTSITGCMSGFNGETEDYKVNLTGGNKSSLEVSEELAAEEKMSIYPNPVSDNLNIKLPQGVSVVNVYDMTGKKVHQENVLNGTMQINVAQWPATQYIVETVYTEGRREVVRFVKQ